MVKENHETAEARIIRILTNHYIEEGKSLELAEHLAEEDLWEYKQGILYS